MSSRGFSLLEVLFAIGIIAVGILAVVSAVAFGLRGGQQGARVTEGTAYARRLIDECRSRNLPFVAPLNDGAAARVALDNAPFGGPSGMPANTGMTRNLTMVPLKAAKTGAADDYKADLAEIRVRVYWSEKGVEKSVDMRALHRRT